MNLKEVKMVVIDDKIYLLSNETNNKHFVFSIGGNLTIGEFDDLLGDEIDWVMNIAIEPEQIGLFYGGLELNEFHRIVPLSDENVNGILANNGKCFIEMINPDEYTHLDLELGGNQFTPVLIDNYVIIHSNEEV
jgi:hypothetical protein